MHILLLTAVVDDLFRYRVRNEVLYLGWLIGLWYNLCQYGVGGFGVWLLGTAFPIACLWALFRFKMMGAADVKTLSVVGGFYGFHEVKYILLVSFLVGAVLSIIQVVRHKNLVVRLRYLVNYITSIGNKEGIRPYHVHGEDEDAIIPFTVAIYIAVTLCTLVLE